MEIKNEDKIPVGGFLDPKTPEKVLGSAASILDEETGKRQSEINNDVQNKLYQNSMSSEEKGKYFSIEDKDGRAIIKLYKNFSINEKGDLLAGTVNISDMLRNISNIIAERKPIDNLGESIVAPITQRAATQGIADAKDDIKESVSLESVNSGNEYAIVDANGNAVLILQSGLIVDKNGHIIINNIDLTNIINKVPSIDSNAIKYSENNDKNIFCIEDSEGHRILELYRGLSVDRKGYFRVGNNLIGTVSLESESKSFKVEDEHGNEVISLESGIRTDKNNSLFIGGKKIKTDNADYEINEIVIDDSMETDILYTARNYILREKEENDGNTYFYFSDDCGITYKKVQNTLGKIAFIHFFSNGDTLLCTNSKCYHTENFDSFTESTVYDYNGEIFVPNSEHFYGTDSTPDSLPNDEGKEIVVWSDYGVAKEYKSRVWYSDNYGKTVKCILKNDETVDINGDIIHVRHFHRAVLDKYSHSIYVTSGDDGNDCKLLRGDIQDNMWVWRVLGMGEKYKFSEIKIGKNYLSCCTDYTTRTLDTGIIQCPIKFLNDPTKFRYLFKTDGKIPTTHIYEDDSGNRILFPDGSGYNTLWYARGNYNFKKIKIITNKSGFIPSKMVGENYSGDVILYANYHTFDNMEFYFSGRKRYKLTDIMRKAGITDFAAIKRNIND